MTEPTKALNRRNQTDLLPFDIDKAVREAQRRLQESINRSGGQHMRQWRAKARALERSVTA